MKIVICYIAVTGGGVTADYCSRFVATYNEFPPGAEHDTIVIGNGGPLPYEIGLLFSGMDVMFYPRQNDGGWDISAYMELAKGVCAPYDMMLCLGESIYFSQSGWLKRIVSAWDKYGPGMYGPFASNLVRPHLNTSAFCCGPGMFGYYPFAVNDRHTRYQFEHGDHPFWEFIRSRNLPVMMVTWDGEWAPNSWRIPANILWRGNQSNCLMHCNHTERYATAPYHVKRIWERGADSPFIGKFGL